MVQRGLSEDVVDKIKALERSVSTARKCEYSTRLQCFVSRRPLALYSIVIFNCRPCVVILYTIGQFSVNVWRGAVNTHCKNIPKHSPNTYVRIYYVYM